MFSWACLVYRSTAEDWTLCLFDPSCTGSKPITVETERKVPNKWIYTKPIDLTKDGNRHVTRYNDGRHGLFAFDTNDRSAVFFVKELVFFKTEEDAEKWITNENGVPRPVSFHTSISLESEASLAQNGMLYKHFEPEKTGTWNFDEDERALAVTYTDDYYRLGEKVVGNWRLCPRFVSSKSNMLYINPRHCHQEYEISVLMSGKAEITCGQKIYALSQGDLIFIPKNFIHLYRSTGDVPLEMITVHFLMPDIGNIPSKTVTMNSKEAQLIGLIADDMEESFGNDENESRYEMSAASKNLFEVFFEYVMKSDSTKNSLERTDALIFNAAIDYMNNNLSRKISVYDIVSACATCKTKLTDIFNRYTQMSCMKYFATLKMERARRLLISGKSCTEVTEMLGFSSLAYFSKCFKLHFGTLPSDVERGM